MELRDLFVFFLVADHPENVEVGEFHPIEHDLVVPDNCVFEYGEKGSGVWILDVEDAVE